MPKLLKLLAINLAIGIFIALSFLTILVYTDTGGIGTLIWQSSDPVIAIILLGVGLCVTFGSAAMGSAVMMMPYEDDE